MKRWSHGHSLGTGVLGGLLLSYRPLYVFVLGIVVGVLLVWAVRGSKRFGSFLRTAERRMERGGGMTRTGISVPAALSDHEREEARREGWKQGERAGIRKAARAEVVKRAEREAMRESLDEFTSELRSDSLERAGVAE